LTTRPIVYGRGDIQAYYDASPPITAYDLKIEKIEGSGDLASVSGTWKMTLRQKVLSP
jgi:hypothetical protein